MKRIALFAAAVLLGISAAAQPSWKWTTVRMDSAFDEIKDSTATLIIAKYSPLVGPLQEIVGYSEDEYEKHRPESGLSNFAADIIREKGEEFCGAHVDVGLTNFGGIRTNLPKGAVRVYDIYSIFPFDNSLLVFDIKGSDLLKFFEKQARRPEALSNVRLDVVDGQIKTLLIGGEPLDPEKIYKFATIDFLMDGGDGVQLKDFAMNIQRTGKFLRDIIIDYIKEMTAAGRTIDLKGDGRVTVTRTDKEGNK
ncbi:MAG: 5'-nucleotidase C-terminal domain-containing protein [Bacteroidales bacterium]|nr:5'-nucleotidase C-terminal domain-containing protein [Bacteroidales bacterium]